ncbi:AraC family transcriptional regulator [Bradyrhizobium septentrionale]|uniref:AraC family transcriptional regulator n=1 Tax=Bradyrhizobium septentrionale TaxID=1404411 RepID=A0A973W871_9BRAD|nr:helix-turn-helix domain-containing protein [Bradyrhizobium septentrionale]UGY17688.1 helix-turn-helix domain-containing protein [Bradyrhizobium septentrionale]UGY26425.1 helix-turn-helix domain-containing protein [Bradyrhizobium septentrionale]
MKQVTRASGESRLGKTRQHLSDQPALPRGVLNPRDSAKRIQVWRYPVSERFSAFLDHHWVIEWNLTGQEPQEQCVLPSPHAHLVVSPRETALFGVVRGVEARRLDGRGRAFGLRFRAGGLRPFLTGPVAALTGRRVSAAIVTGQDDATLEAAILGCECHEAMIRAAEAVLEPRLPAPDRTVELISSIIATIRHDGGPRRAEALAGAFGMSLRTLQRLFCEYVGVSPKWTIRRYRLQEAQYLLARSDEIPLAALASDLGYFDQAHLAGDFRRLFGCAPAQYRDRQKS